MRTVFVCLFIYIFACVLVLYLAPKHDRSLHSIPSPQHQGTSPTKQHGSGCGHFPAQLEVRWSCTFRAGFFGSPSLWEVCLIRGESLAEILGADARLQPPAINVCSDRGVYLWSMSGNNFLN